MTCWRAARGSRSVVAQNTGEIVRFDELSVLRDRSDCCFF